MIERSYLLVPRDVECVGDAVLDLGGRLGSWVDVQTVLRGHAVAGLSFHGEVVLRREPELSDHLVFDVTWIPDSISSTYNKYKYSLCVKLKSVTDSLALITRHFPMSDT